jgi:hypothetical protein
MYIDKLMIIYELMIYLQYKKFIVRLGFLRIILVYQNSLFNINSNFYKNY